MDFEAKAREVLLELLGTFSDATDRDSLCFIADALRAAALDEGAREAARAEVGDLLRTFRYEGLYTNPRPTVGDGSRFDRLLWILGLSEGERRFVKALAEDVADFDMAQVYADWLEDDGRTAAGIRVRRLVPRDGDVLLWRVPPADGPDYDPVVAARPLAQGLCDQLMARGVGTTCVVLPADSDLSALPADAMRAAGWVRAGDAHRAQLERIALELEDIARRGGGVFATPDMLEARAFQLRHLAAGD
jgi:uncharacterized protein (TIGR02996 family)